MRSSKPWTSTRIEGTVCRNIYIESPEGNVAKISSWKRKPTHKMIDDSFLLSAAPNLLTACKAALAYEPRIKNIRTRQLLQRAILKAEHGK